MLVRMSTRTAPTSRPHAATVSVRSWALAIATAFAAAGGASAQSQATGTTRAAITMSAGLTVPYRFYVRQRAPLRVVEQRQGVTEYELELEAASNVTWRLALEGPLDSDSGFSARTEVQDELGVWQPLARGGAPVVVASQRPPCNPTPLRLRVRVYDDATIVALRTPRFVMGTAAGAF
jgi:hypothetical protein